MKETVKITVTGTHDRPGVKPEETVTCVDGTYRFEDGVHVVEYMEEMGDGDDKLLTFNRVRITDSTMSIERKGSVEASLSFSEGAEHESDYRTPFGQMKMKMKTTRYACYVMEKGNRLVAEAEYTVAMSGMELSKTLIRLDIVSDTT